MKFVVVHSPYHFWIDYAMKQNDDKLERDAVQTCRFKYDDLKPYIVEEGECGEYECVYKKTNTGFGSTREHKECWEYHSYMKIGDGYVRADSFTFREIENNKKN